MATRTIATGKIVVEGENSKFTRANNQNIKGLNKMQKAFARNQRQMRTFNTMGGKVKTMLAGMAASFAAVFGARFLKDKIKELADFAAGVYESSVRLGVHTEFLQAWQRAFEGESGTIAGADKALEKFTKAVFDSRREIRRGNFDTGTYSDTFKQLGITAAQVKNLRIEQLLGLVARGMENLSNEADVTGAGLTLFGQRGKSAINVLMDGMEEFQGKMAHFKSLGTLRLDESMGLKEVSQAFTDLGNVTRTLFSKVVVKYKDQIISFIQALMDLAKASADAFDTHFNTMAKIASKVVSMFGIIIELIPRLKAYVTALAVVLAGKFAISIGVATAAVWAQVGAWKALKWAIARTGIGLLVVAIGEGIYWFSRLTQAAGGFRGAMKTVWEAIKQTFEKAWSLIKAYQLFKQGVFLSISSSIMKAMARGLKSVINFVNQGRRYFAGLKASMIALVKNIDEIALGFFSDEGKTIAEVMAEGFKEGFDSIEDIGGGALDAINEKVKTVADTAKEKFKEAGEELAKVAEGYKFSAIPTPPKNRGSRRGGRFGPPVGDPTSIGEDDLLGGDGQKAPLGIFEQVAQNMKLQKIQEAFKAREEAEKARAEYIKTVSDGVAGVGRAMTETLMEGEFQLHKLRDQGLEAAKDIANKFADKAIWEPFSDTISNLIDKLVTGITNALEGANTGGSFSSLFSGSKASGGFSQRGMPQRINERGARGEIFVPNQNGTILNPQQQQNAMNKMGQVVFAPTINTDNPELVRAVMAQELPNFINATHADAVYQANKPGVYSTAIRGGG